nr:hypothetical protein [Nostoc sp. ChiQUE02]
MAQFWQKNVLSKLAPIMADLWHANGISIANQWNFEAFFINKLKLLRN